MTDKGKLQEEIEEEIDVDHRHNVNESADKIQVKWVCKRGEGTRDEDRFDVKVKGDSSKEVVDWLATFQKEVKENLMPRAREVLHDREDDGDD